MSKDGCLHPSTISLIHPRGIKVEKIKQPCWIEEKIDGWRLLLYKGHAYGRKPDSLDRWINKWDKLPASIKQLATDEPVDGEIVVPGKAASHVSTALANKDKNLRFIGFYLPLLKLYPHQHIKFIKQMGFQTPLSYDEYLKIDTPQVELLITLAKEKGIEGWIAKERSLFSTWWKIKVINTYDLIITGLNWPTSGRFKQAGWVKSLACSTYVAGKLKVVANVSGMNDAVRAGISKRDIGRVIEVRANLLASKGMLKHSRFIRFRDDKDAKECTLKV